MGWSNVMEGGAGGARLRTGESFDFHLWIVSGRFCNPMIRCFCMQF